MYPGEKEAKEIIISIGKKMSEARFVTANDGNITIRVSDEAVWATPTGVNKGDLTEDKLLRVKISDGSVLEGTWKPTTELQMHLTAYRTDNSLMSTAHAHPLNLCVLACSGIELDLPSTPAAVVISGRVPVIPYCCSGTKALADSIIPYVKKYHVVNLGNHGPIAWGKSPWEAWYRLEDAEASAKLALELVRLGRMCPLNSAQVQELIRFHRIDIEPKAYVAKYEGEENQRSGVPFTEVFQELISSEK